MDFKAGYDMDGVLAVQPPEWSTPWRKMNSEQRRAKQRWLVDWYVNAPQLLIPEEPRFIVITARKCTDEIRKVSLNWLSQKLAGKEFQLHMLMESRNIENVVKFKSEVIRNFDLKDYTEDNRQVVTALRKILPKVRIWHYKKGRRILDYETSF